jgi:hypothetical protein
MAVMCLELHVMDCNMMHLELVEACYICCDAINVALTCYFCHVTCHFCFLFAMLLSNIFCHVICHDSCLCFVVICHDTCL